MVTTTFTSTKLTAPVLESIKPPKQSAVIKPFYLVMCLRQTSGRTTTRQSMTYMYLQITQQRSLSFQTPWQQRTLRMLLLTKHSTVVLTLMHLPTNTSQVILSQQKFEHKRPVRELQHLSTNHPPTDMLHPSTKQPTVGIFFSTWASEDARETLPILPRAN